MKQNKDQTSVLIWAATAVFFLYILFRLKVLEDIGQAAYIPGLALLCLAAQIANHEQAAVALRKKSPNFTNSFYPENGRMVIGNIVASALVLELNTFNYQQVQLNFALELVSIPLILAIIFLTENSRGGFLTLDRIYFPKKWDQFFKNYGTNLLSLLLMTAMWLPVILKVPVWALLWILISALLLKQSVVYTNKYNHQGWCFFLEGLLVLQLLTLGFGESNLFLIAVGAAAGLLFLVIYMRRLKYEKGLVGLAGLLFAGGLLAFYHFGGEDHSMVFYIQWETALFAGIFVLIKLLSAAYRKWIRPEDVDKYSYDGAVVDKNWQEQEAPGKKEGGKQPTLLKIKEKPQKVGRRLKVEEKQGKAPEPLNAKMKTKTVSAGKSKEAALLAASQVGSAVLPAKKPKEATKPPAKQRIQPDQTAKTKNFSGQAAKSKENAKAAEFIKPPAQTGKSKTLSGQTAKPKENAKAAEFISPPAQTGKPKTLSGQTAKVKKKGKPISLPEQVLKTSDLGQGRKTKDSVKLTAAFINPGMPSAKVKAVNLSKEEMAANRSKSPAKRGSSALLGQTQEISGLKQNQEPKSKRVKAKQEKTAAKVNKHRQKTKTAGLAKEKLIIYPKSEIHLKQPQPAKTKKTLKEMKPAHDAVQPAAKKLAENKESRKIKQFRRKKTKKLAPSAAKE